MEQEQQPQRQKWLNYGVPSDRTREQFTAQIMRHPAGEPGQAYVAEVIANVRADTLTELQASVADFAWEATPAKLEPSGTS